MNVISRTRGAKILGGIALVGASALVLAGCSGGGNDAAAPSASSGGGGAVSEADGTFSVGTILPATGNLAFLGPPRSPV